MAPVLDEGATEVPVVLPGGGMWYDNLDGTAIDGDMEANKNFRWVSCWHICRRQVQGRHKGPCALHTHSFPSTC